jgi:hypothetical protein
VVVNGILQSFQPYPLSGIHLEYGIALEEYLQFSIVNLLKWAKEKVDILEI